MMKWNRGVFLFFLVLSITAAPAFAKDDRVSFANDIVINEGSASGDLVCMLCSIKVHGDVHGDIVALLGSVTVDDEHSISGDVAIVGGDASLGSGASIGGDLAVVGGHLNTGPDASVRGDSKVMEGRGWLLAPLAPVLILIGIIWLLVWLVSRRRYPPMYPQGRRF